jgi:dihydrofolate reductase
MAKLIVSNIVSLDGYIAGPGGNPAVLPMDQAFDAYNLERLRAAGTLVLGRKTFEMFRAFWPAVQHPPEAPPTRPPEGRERQGPARLRQPHAVERLAGGGLGR